MARDRAVVLAAFLIATIGFFTSEKVGINNGLGWDGAIYAGWVRDFSASIDDGIDAYRIQRIFPAAVAHCALRPFIGDIKDKHIIRVYGVINIIGTMLVALFWCKIAGELKIGHAGKWLGFAGLILNFAMTKNAYFNPVLTDVTAMAIATAMCYCYLRGWQFRLLFTMVLGAFTWPTLIYIGAVLVLFPRRPQTDLPVRPAPRRMNLLAASLVTFYIGLWTVYVLADIKGPVFGFLEPIRSVLPLSVLLSVLYLFCALVPLLDCDRLYQPRRYWTRGNLAAVLALVAVIIAVKAAQAGMSVRGGYMALITYLLLIGIESTAKPGVFFVMNVAYFGPLVIVALFVWKPVCRLIHEHGLGLTMAVAIGVIHSIDSESRHFNYLIPLVFPFIVKAIEPLGWSRAQYVLIMVLAAISTKAWLSIKGQFQDNSFLYPDQLYWMHHGPFLGNEMYLVHAGATALSAILIYVVCFQQRPAPRAPELTASRLPAAAGALLHPRPRAAAGSDDRAWPASA
jgi:hypothetical protein